MPTYLGFIKKPRLTLEVFYIFFFGVICFIYIYIYKELGDMSQITTHS